MKNVILFGMGNNGKTMLDAYGKYDPDFKIIAIADNNVVNNSVVEKYQNIPVIHPEKITDYTFDEIWIASIYYRDIRKQLIEDYGIVSSLIRYVEYPMPFLENQIYRKYEREMSGNRKCDSLEKQELLDYIMKNGARMYCYSFFDEYMEKEIPVYYDSEKGVYYGNYKNYRMYLSRKFDTLEKARMYLRYAYMEQDERSPHCYFTGSFQVGNGEIGIDIGAAEGIFALQVLEKVGHIYLIEADHDWCEALAFTFQPYKDKVTIIQGYAGETENKKWIKLDSKFQDIEIDFIKMDIEGAELAALSGGRCLISRCKPKLAVCTYHNALDNERITEWLSEKGYKCKNSNGYVICQGEWELEHISDVDFRRALLWATP